MSGLHILNTTPSWVLAALLIGLCVFFSVGLQLLIRRIYGVDFIASNHEVAGFKYAVVGVAYAVLLAFVVVSVWEDFDETQQDVHAEAGRFYDVYRNSFDFAEEDGAKIRAAIIAYAKAVREKDWPAMRDGFRGSDEGADAYTRLSRTVGEIRAKNTQMLPSLDHAIALQQDVADYRIWRLSDVGGHMTPMVWFVLILGGIITLAYPAFFATKKVGPQVLMTAGLAMIIGATFLLAVNLNYPFSGPEPVDPAAIDTVIERMATEEAKGE
ncbi:MAG: DUF4239 domain-containing protein [Methyloceanibacter sp.]|nr:DUF4239 domain-containing protein [Methyloceanibacter sp.]